MRFVAIKLIGGSGLWVRSDKIQIIEHLKSGGCRVWVESCEGLQKFDSPHEGSSLAATLNGD